MSFEALLSDDNFMTWALVGSVYLMLCAMGWRSTSPANMRHKPRRRPQQWNLLTCLLYPVLLVMCLPSVLTVTALRELQDSLRGR